MCRLGLPTIASAVAPVVQLERRMREPVALGQHRFDLAAYRMAVGARRHQHVRRQRGKPGTHFPDVEIVHAVNAGVTRERLSDLRDAHSGRRCLE